MAETIALKVAIDTGKSAKNLGDLEKSAEELNKLLKGAEFGTKEFEELSGALRDVNKQIKNTELSMEALDNEQVASEIGSVAGAVGDMTAAFILLGGDEDSAIGETAKRIETALGVTMAFKGAIEGVISFQKLWNNTLKQTSIVQSIIATGTKVYAVAQGILNFVIGAGSKALKLFRLALISTGIGAIVVGIGLLIANFGKVKDVIMDVINTAIAPFRKALQWIGLIESDEESARKKRAKAQRARAKQRKKELEQEIKLMERRLDLDRKATDELIANTERYIALQKEKGVDVTQMEEQLLKDKISFAEKDFEKVKEVEAKKRKLIEDEIKKKEKSLKSSYARNVSVYRNSLNDELTELKLQLDGTVTAEKDALEKIRQAKHDEAMAEAEIENKRKEDEEKRREERRKERKKRLETEKQALFDLEVARKEADAEDILDAREKAEALIEIERFKHEKELEDKKLTDGEKELLEFEYQQRISDIAQEFADKELEKEEAERERLVELQKEKEEKEKEAREKKLEADKELAEKRIELEQRVEDESFNLALGGIDALIQLNDAFQGQTEAQQKKAFERNKKLQIAQALIGASQGVVNILSNASTIPDPFGTIYKVGQLAILSAVTTAQIAKISQQQFSGGGSPSAPAISGAGGGAPSLGAITNTSTLVPQEAQQVFVTETDITNTQNKVAVIENQATIK